MISSALKPLRRPVKIRRPSSLGAHNRSAISVSVNSRGKASGAGNRAVSAASRGGEAASLLPPTASGHQRCRSIAAGCGVRGKKLDQPYCEEPERCRCAEADAGVASIKRASRQLRHGRRFEDFHVGCPLAVALFQPRQRSEAARCSCSRCVRSSCIALNSPKRTMKVCTALLFSLICCRNCSTASRAAVTFPSASATAAR